jgi:hypothetical protein
MWTHVLQSESPDYWPPVRETPDGLVEEDADA